MTDIIPRLSAFLDTDRSTSSATPALLPHLLVVTSTSFQNALSPVATSSENCRGAVISQQLGNPASLRLFMRAPTFYLTRSITINLQFHRPKEKKRMNPTMSIKKKQQKGEEEEEKELDPNSEAAKELAAHYSRYIQTEEESVSFIENELLPNLTQVADIYLDAYPRQLVPVKTLRRFLMKFTGTLKKLAFHGCWQNEDHRRCSQEKEEEEEGEGEGEEEESKKNRTRRSSSEFDFADNAGVGFTFLSHFRNLESLTLPSCVDHNPIPKWQIVQQQQQQTPAQKSIKMEGFNFDDEVAEKVLPNLKHLKEIAMLGLSDVTEKTLALLSKHCMFLEKFDFTYAGEGIESLDCLSEMICLSTLDFQSSMHLKSVNFLERANFSPVLKELDLNECGELDLNEALTHGLASSLPALENLNLGYHDTPLKVEVWEEALSSFVSSSSSSPASSSSSSSSSCWPNLRRIGLWHITLDKTHNQQSESGEDGDDDEEKAEEGNESKEVDKIENKKKKKKSREKKSEGYRFIKALVDANKHSLEEVHMRGSDTAWADNSAISLFGECSQLRKLYFDFEREIGKELNWCFKSFFKLELLENLCFTNSTAEEGFYLDEFEPSSSSSSGLLWPNLKRLDLTASSNFSQKSLLAISTHLSRGRETAASSATIPSAHPLDHFWMHPMWNAVVKKTISVQAVVDFAVKLPRLSDICLANAFSSPPKKASSSIQKQQQASSKKKKQQEQQQQQQQQQQRKGEEAEGAKKKDNQEEEEEQEKEKKKKQEEEEKRKQEELLKKEESPKTMAMRQIKELTGRNVRIS